MEFTENNKEETTNIKKRTYGRCYLIQPEDFGMTKGDIREKWDLVMLSIIHPIEKLVSGIGVSRTNNVIKNIDGTCKFFKDANFDGFMRFLKSEVKYNKTYFITRINSMSMVYIAVIRENIIYSASDFLEYSDIDFNVFNIYEQHDYRRRSHIESLEAIIDYLDINPGPNLQFIIWYLKSVEVERIKIDWGAQNEPIIVDGGLPIGSTPSKKPGEDSSESNGTYKEITDCDEHEEKDNRRTKMYGKYIVFTPSDFGINEHELYKPPYWNIMVLSIIHPIEIVTKSLDNNRTERIEKFNGTCNLYKRTDFSGFTNFMESEVVEDKTYFILRIRCNTRFQVSIIRDNVIYSPLNFCRYDEVMDEFMIYEHHDNERKSHLESLEDMIRHFKITPSESVKFFMQLLRHNRKADNYYPGAKPVKHKFDLQFAIDKLSCAQNEQRMKSMKKTELKNITNEQLKSVNIAIKKPRLKYDIENMDFSRFYPPFFVPFEKHVQYNIKEAEYMMELNKVMNEDMIQLPAVVEPPCGKDAVARKVKDFFKELNIRLDVTNLNPLGIQNSTGDCYIQALMCLTGKSWRDVMDELVEIGAENYLVPNDHKTILRFLEKSGYIFKYHEIFPLRKHDMDEKPLKLGDFLRMVSEKNINGRYLISIPRHIMFYEFGTLYNPATTEISERYYSQLNYYLNTGKVCRYIEIFGKRVI